MQIVGWNTEICIANNLQQLLYFVLFGQCRRWTDKGKPRLIIKTDNYNEIVINNYSSGPNGLLVKLVVDSETMRVRGVFV